MLCAQQRHGWLVSPFLCSVLGTIHKAPEDDGGKRAQCNEMGRKLAPHSADALHDSQLG